MANFDNIKDSEMNYTICIFDDCDLDAHPLSPYCFGHMEAEIAEAEVQRKIAAGAWFEGKKLVDCPPIREIHVKEENTPENPSTPAFDPFATFYGPAFCLPAAPAPLYDENRASAGDGEF